MKVNRAFRRIRTIGAYRDTFLVFASLAYVTGFVVWSLVAWRRGLGALPVLDAQYFVAGLPPLLTVLAVLVFLAYGRSFVLKRWPRYFRRLPASRQLFIGLALLLALAVSLLVLAFLERVSAWTNYTPESLRVVFAITAGAAYVLVPVEALDARLRRYVPRARTGIRAHVTALLVNQVRRLVNNIQARKKRQYVYGVPLLAGAFTVYMYVTTYYEMIPQALGGAKTRCATLDVDLTKLSPYTRGLLRIPSGCTGVARTADVKVYFAGSDTMLIAIQDVSRRDQIVELARESVRAVHWCDPRGA